MVCLETCCTAYDLMKDCLNKLDLYINHRICDMMPSNATLETPCDNNLFVSSLLRFKKMNICRTFTNLSDTHHMQSKMLYCFIDMKEKMEKITTLNIPEKNTAPVTKLSS